MEHIPDNPIDVNADLAPTLTARQAEFITFLCRSKGDLEALQQHFELGALELVEFFSSKLCKAKLDGLLDNLNVVLQIAATQVQHVAMHHLQNVCEKLESQPDKIEKLRLSSTALGRLATAARPPRTSTPRKPVVQPDAPQSDTKPASSSSRPARHDHVRTPHINAAPAADSAAPTTNSVHEEIERDITPPSPPRPGL